MVETSEEKKEMEKIKHKNKLEEFNEREKMSVNEHKRKLERLDKMIELAKLGWKSENGDQNE